YGELCVVTVALQLANRISGRGIASRAHEVFGRISAVSAFSGVHHDNCGTVMIESDPPNAVDDIVVALGYIGLLLLMARELKQAVQDDEFRRMLGQRCPDELITTG